MPDPISAPNIPEEASPTRPLAIVVDDPDGTPAAKLVDLNAQYAPLAYARSGSGAPNGVVTGNVGDRYIDIAATLGARVWYKASGSGNTGWLVEIGDTGWRTLSSWDAVGTVTGWALNASTVAPRPSNAGGISVRRTGDVVRLAVRNLNSVSTASTLSIFDTEVLPVGFRPTTAETVLNPIFQFASPNQMILQTSAGSVQKSGFSTITTGFVTGGHTSWITNEAWPSTLPGT